MPVSSFTDILYFNFVTILTVGYGDMQPDGIGRFVAVVEALIGVGLFGGIIGVVVLKLTQPKKNSIVFSNQAYYAMDEQRFFIMFVNTSNAQLINAQISYSVNLGHHSKVKPSKTSPYISDSVWILNLSKCLRKDLRDMELYHDDGLKFAVSGTYGFTAFATAVEYEIGQILAVPSRTPLERELLLSAPKFGSPEFERVFHYLPEGSMPFLTYAQNCGAKTNQESIKQAAELTHIGVQLPQHQGTIHNGDETVIFKRD